jgi:hypothetical protein
MPPTSQIGGLQEARAEGEPGSALARRSGGVGRVQPAAVESRGGVDAGGGLQRARSGQQHCIVQRVAESQAGHFGPGRVEGGLWGEVVQQGVAAARSGFGRGGDGQVVVAVLVLAHTQVVAARTVKDGGS